jgi:hypothetical protein
MKRKGHLEKVGKDKRKMLKQNLQEEFDVG